MAKKNQSKRLTDQHKKSLGVIGIFGENAKIHDLTVGEVSVLVMKQLQEENPHLTFRYRKIIRKEEINKVKSEIADVKDDLQVIKQLMTQLLSKGSNV
mgnify:CR=1 FL=1